MRARRPRQSCRHGRNAHGFRLPSGVVGVGEFPWPTDWECRHVLTPFPFATASFLSELECTFRSRHLRRVSEQDFMCLDVLAVRRIDVLCCPFPRRCRRAVIVVSYSMSQPIYHPQCHQARSESRDLARQAQTNATRKAFPTMASPDAPTYLT